jgi:tRNA A-37 threonylcarbamoyl transferase component Bud32
MSIRRLLRGTVSDEQLESVAREAADLRGETLDTVRLLEADNWLSTPAVVNETFFIKVITRKNTAVHGLLTTWRNLGIFSSGNEAFFQRFDTPVEMADHELAAARQIRDLGVNVPEPLAAFEHEGYGVVVFEYLDSFETLEELDSEAVAAVAPAIFDSLSVMHEAGIVHGDLRAENVLVADGDLYFIDATNVAEDALEDARAYDIACALAVLEPRIGAAAAVETAAEHTSEDILLAAESYLDFVNMRPDHRFESLAVRGEIEKAVR